MIRFRARSGQVMFAFHPMTDPLNVIVELAWAYTACQPICGSKGCPATQGSYCLECHMTAAGLRAVYEKREAHRAAMAARWSS